MLSAETVTSSCDSPPQADAHCIVQLASGPHPDGQPQASQVTGAGAGSSAEALSKEPYPGGLTQSDAAQQVTDSSIRIEDIVPEGDSGGIGESMSESMPEARVTDGWHAASVQDAEAAMPEGIADARAMRSGLKYESELQALASDTESTLQSEEHEYAAAHASSADWHQLNLLLCRNGFQALPEQVVPLHPFLIVWCRQLLTIAYIS